MPSSAPVIVAGFLSAAALTFFVLTYTRAYPYIEFTHYENFAQNAPRILAEDGLERAIPAAGYAASRLGFNVEAHVLHGQLLKQAGKFEEARAALERAVSLRMTPPPYRGTRLPAYHVIARLELAELESEPCAGLRQRVYASALTDLTDSRFAPYWEGLYDSFSTCGLWGRALAFSKPPSETLASLAPDSLRGLARACISREIWEMAEPVAKALEPLDAGLAALLQGYSLRARGDASAAAAQLQLAALAGEGGAAFEWGRTLEALGEESAARAAYAQERPDSLYFPFAKALSNDAGDAEALVELEKLIAAGHAAMDSSHYASKLPNTDVIPVGVSVDSRYLSNGGRFPVSVLWRTNMIAPAVGVVEAEDRRLELRFGQWLLRLEWAENLLPMGTAANCAGATCPPIWDEAAAHIVDEVVAAQTEGAGPQFLASTAFRLSYPGIYVFGVQEVQASGAEFSWATYGGENETILRTGSLSPPDIEAGSDWSAGIGSAERAGVYSRIVVAERAGSRPSIESAFAARIHAPAP